MIVKPADFYREQAVAFARAATDKFQNAIRPIYGHTTGLPNHIGSCIFVKIGGHLLLLTAGHIIDERKFTTLYVAAPSDLIRLRYDRGFATNPEKSRDEDRFDFALMQISAEMIKDLSSITYIDEQDFQDKQPSRIGHVYIACGFPNSRNSRVDGLARKINGRMWTYISRPIENNMPARKLGLGDDSHVFLDFNSKKSLDIDGKRMNSLKPVGVSGGALFDIGYFGDAGLLASSPMPPPKLAGMLIEYSPSDKAMIAVGMNAVMEGYRRSFFK